MLSIIIHLFVIIPIFNTIKALKQSHYLKFILASIVFSGILYLHYSEFVQSGNDPP